MRKIEALLEVPFDETRDLGGPPSKSSGANSALLLAAIQTRLWSLMQLNLLDPAAPRKLIILEGDSKPHSSDRYSHKIIHSQKATEEESLQADNWTDLCFDSQETLVGSNLDRDDLLFNPCWDQRLKFLDYELLDDDEDDDTLCDDEAASEDLFWEALDLEKEIDATDEPFDWAEPDKVPEIRNGNGKISWQEVNIDPMELVNEEDLFEEGLHMELDTMFPKDTPCGTMIDGCFSSDIQDSLLDDELEPLLDDNQLHGGTPVTVKALDHGYSCKRGSPKDEILSSHTDVWNEFEILF